MSKWTASPHAVAVVGMSCRAPGAATPDQLWTLLRDGVDATGETPSDRYDVDELHSGTGEPGKLASRRGGYVENMADFDARFFDMSPSDAEELDPQQRLLMMTAWEALEDAGQPPDGLAGSRTGVFVGNGRADYMERAFRQGFESASAGQFNNVRSMLPARLSHYFDLRGPSIVIDTACSSSLVAVHQAVQSLRTGECPFALAAGVNLTLRADESVMMSQIGGMAPDGRSKFGDANADGHSPSDAVVVIALKPLAAAIAAGDRVRAVIAGSAIGNDGRTSESILNPSLRGQQEILHWAYQDAGISPSDVDFVEAHGSGSPQLDPLELTALSQVMCADRAADRPLLVGSVKSNVGHAEAAGNLVGLVKTVMSLEHGQVPASLHVDQPRDDVDWDKLPIEIPSQLRDLPKIDRPLVAGVTGQGSTALNAHVVLHQAEPAHLPRHVHEGRLPYPLVLSARTPQALAELSKNYLTYLDGPGRSHTVGDICRSAATRRQHLEHRLAVAGATHDDLIAGLNGARGIADPALASLIDLYHAGNDIDWVTVFGGPGPYVQLPTYPWQLQRYWPGQTESGDDVVDLADEILTDHARTEYDTESRLADIGIDSLAKLKLIVELQKKTGHEVDPEEFDRVHTVGELREWTRELVAAANDA